jgi:hypothetical protein
MAPAFVSGGITYIVHVGSVRVSLKSHYEKLIINMQSPKI